MPRQQWLFVVLMACVVVGLMAFQVVAPHYYQRSEHTEQTRPQPNQQVGESKSPLSNITLTDIATLALAAATFTLCFFTYRSVKVAESALTVLERAYVFPSVIDLDQISPELRFRIRMRSMGRTPAIMTTARTPHYSHTTARYRAASERDGCDIKYLI